MRSLAPGYPPGPTRGAEPSTRTPAGPGRVWGAGVRSASPAQTRSCPHRGLRDPRRPRSRGRTLPAPQQSGSCAARGPHVCGCAARFHRTPTVQAPGSDASLGAAVRAGGCGAPAARGVRSATASLGPGEQLRVPGGASRQPRAAAPRSPRPRTRRGSARSRGPARTSPRAEAAPGMSDASAPGEDRRPQVPTEGTGTGPAYAPSRGHGPGPDASGCDLEPDRTRGRGPGPRLPRGATPDCDPDSPPR